MWSCVHWSSTLHKSKFVGPPMRIIKLTLIPFSSKVRTFFRSSVVPCKRNSYHRQGGAAFLFCLPTRQSLICINLATKMCEWKFFKIIFNIDIQFCTPLKNATIIHVHPLFYYSPAVELYWPFVSEYSGGTNWLLIVDRPNWYTETTSMCRIEPVSVRSVMISMVPLFRQNRQRANGNQRIHAHWILQRRRWPMTIAGSGPTGRRCDVNVEACTMDFLWNILLRINI